MAKTLWLVGYGAWPVAKRVAGLVRSLQERGVRRLVDVRLMPCSSDLEPGRPYGPKAWNLQLPGQGIAALLEQSGISYEWMVELGNPQRQDPEMLILRSQLADQNVDWPVHRGLARLAEIVRASNDDVALLCACADGAHCHRLVVAEALRDRHFGGALNLRETRTKT